MGLNTFLCVFIFAILKYDVYGITITTELSLDNGAYNVTAVADTSTGKIEFTVRVETYGWIGLGVGPNPSMLDADIVVGERYHNNNTVTSTDMYAPNIGRPIRDDKPTSDWEFVSGNANSSYTRRTYRRLLRTNDWNDKQDFEIKNENLYFIWAYGSEVNMTYHESDKRGWFRVNFLRESETTTTTRRPSTTETTPIDSVVKEHSFNNGAYRVRSEAFNSAGMISFTITARTLGCIAIGVGPNPNMANSDVVIGGFNYVDESNYYSYRDMHAKSNGILVGDTSGGSDWNLQNADTSSLSTTLIYTRNFRTYDGYNGEDFEIKDEELFLIMAYGDNDTISQQCLTYQSYEKVNLRGHRGGASILNSITTLILFCGCLLNVYSNLI